VLLPPLLINLFCCETANAGPASCWTKSEHSSHSQFEAPRQNRPGPPPARNASTFLIFPNRPRAQTIPVTFPGEASIARKRRIEHSFSPLGSCESRRQLNLKTEALVYPSVAPSVEYLEILRSCMEGRWKPHHHGPRSDLYAPVGMIFPDSARNTCTGKLRALRH